MTLDTIIPTRMWQWATRAGAAGAARNAGMACRARHDAIAAVDHQLTRMLPPAGRDVAA